jgi:hypothetical protein
MRYVCHVYEDGSIYAYETTDNGFRVLRTFEGQAPDPPIKRISAYAEFACDNNEKGIARLKQAMARLQNVVRQEIGE